MPLTDYLLKSELETVYLREIEAILGFPLPKSAKYRAFWENAQSHKRVQSEAWMSAGYTTKVKLGKQTIIFQKITTPTATHTRTDSFEELAREAMSAYFGVPLRHRRKPEWPKLFGLVSDDYQIVGDVKCLTMGGASCLPPAKASIISELVWMLEKTGAEKQFIVFGKDKRVAKEWLRRYGDLVNSVAFFFLFNNAGIEQL